MRRKEALCTMIGGVVGAVLVLLWRAGATVADMQTAGRWQSPSMPAPYTGAELAERSAIARFKDGK